MQSIHWTDRNAGTARLRVALLAVCGLLPLSLEAQAPPQPNLPPAQMPAVPAAARPVVQPRFSVVLDAAHGGTDSGAQISEHLPEKDLTLALSARLRAALETHSIPLMVTRDSDASISLLDRAQAANHAVASACITIHATTTGSGVHLFTSSLAQTPQQTSPARFLPWQSAQSAYVTQSLRLSSEISSTLGRAAIPVTLGRTSMEPMDSLTCPAVAVEVAPWTRSGKSVPLTDPDYQKKLVDALLSALQQWQNDWRQQP